MQVRIYHPNRRFSREGREAISKEEFDFEFMKVWGGEVEFEGPFMAEKFLEDLWRHVEVGGPDCVVPRTVDNPAAIRSFMVGDVVALGENSKDREYWLCASVGWKKLDW